MLETARYLGVGVVSADARDRSQGVVIGGAMTFGGHETAPGRKFLDRVQARGQRRRRFRSWPSKTTIDYASLGGDAGYIGAAGLARRDASANTSHQSVSQSARPSLTTAPMSVIGTFVQVQLDCKHIRNFSIIAHIDHGKSTLADQFLLEDRHDQPARVAASRLLDDMDLERERGITIKARAVTIYYTLQRAEVRAEPDRHARATSTSTTKCRAAWPPARGPILLVDAFQGVQAQTVANAYPAMEHDLTIVPVLNKIDLHARPADEVIDEMEHGAGDRPRRGPARQRQDRHRHRRAARRRSSSASRRRRAIPTRRCRRWSSTATSTTTRASSSTSASWTARVRKGPEDPLHARRHRRTKSSSWASSAPQRDAVRRARAPARSATSSPTSRRSPTSTSATRSPMPRRHRRRAAARLQGAEADGLSAACIPSDGQDFEDLRDALDKLTHQRSQLRVRAGNERRPRLRLPLRLPGHAAHGDHPAAAGAAKPTSTWCRPRPNVTYEILTTQRRDAATSTTRRRCPTPGEIEEFREPIVRVNFVLPTEYIGAIMQLCTDRRGVYVRTEYLSPDAGDPRLRPAAGGGDLRPVRQAQERHARLRHDGLRAASATARPTWCGSTSWSTATASTPCRSSCTAATPTAAAAAVVKKLRERDRPAHVRGRASRPPSAAAIIARETIAAMRKNVTAKCYGGDITRKRKLWAKQKEGKKRMKQIGRSRSRRRRSWRCSTPATPKSNPGRHMASALTTRQVGRRLVESRR